MQLGGWNIRQGGASEYTTEAGVVEISNERRERIETSHRAVYKYIWHRKKSGSRGVNVRRISENHSNGAGLERGLKGSLCSLARWVAAVDRASDMQDQRRNNLPTKRLVAARV